MEINRDQIIKALECCVNHMCNECPLRDGRCANGEMGRLALAIIKELTEENAKLARSCTELTQKCASLTSESVEKCASVKADTVRKMQNEVKERCRDLFSGLDVCIIVDQIANELLEEDV